MRESSTMVEAGRSTGKNHPIAGTYNGRPSSQKKKTATAVSTADGLRRHSILSAPRDNDQRSAFSVPSSSHLALTLLVARFRCAPLGVQGGATIDCASALHESHQLMARLLLIVLLSGLPSAVQRMTVVNGSACLESRSTGCADGRDRRVAADAAISE
jgi:hypothetical protein